MLKYLELISLRLGLPLKIYFISFPKTSISLLVKPLFAKILLFVFFTITDLDFDDNTFHFSVFGLKNVKFARLGGIHRNTYINSPALLNYNLSLIGDERIKFAGQITGVEGYVESTAIGACKVAMIGSGESLKNIQTKKLSFKPNKNLEDNYTNRYNIWKDYIEKSLRN